MRELPLSPCPSGSPPPFLFLSLPAFHLFLLLQFIGQCLNGIPKLEPIYYITDFNFFFQQKLNELVGKFNAAEYSMETRPSASSWWQLNFASSRKLTPVTIQAFSWLVSTLPRLPSSIGWPGTIHRERLCPGYGMAMVGRRLQNPNHLGQSHAGNLRLLGSSSILNDRWWCLVHLPRQATAADY